uniref:GIY-YIG domain-containing protein n=1 Tax=Cacopsylla melanoneura TaxID=428564 RepID=A0A8D9AER1_9HEMI
MCLFLILTSLKTSFLTIKTPSLREESQEYIQISVPGHGEYIGKTRRAINTRIKEHFSPVTNIHPEKSGFADYNIMVKHNLPTSLCQVKVLHSGHVNYRKLGLLETSHIRSALDNG